jgi:hypothetical protein
VILALKLLLSPLLIAAATLAGRRWGPAVSGWFVGFPLVSAPVSIVLATQSGTTFAANAATGMLIGQASMCIFCAVYILLARKLKWWQTIPPALAVFFALVAVWNHFPLSLLPSFAILVGTILLLLLVIPKQIIPGNSSTNPWWDLPARMVTAGLFVVLLTSVAPILGPALSGMLSAFPVFGTVLATFTHAQQGGRAAGQLLRGSILGSFGIAVFYLVLGLVLPLTGSLWTYLLAATATLLTNGISLQFTLAKKVQPPQYS